MEGDNRDLQQERVVFNGLEQRASITLPERSRSLNLGEINGKCSGRISLKRSRHTIKPQVAGGGRREGNSCSPQRA